MKSVLLVSLMIVLCILLSACLRSFAKGDLNSDWQITQADCSIASSIAVGATQPTQQQMKNGDMNGDGRINSADVAIICRMAK